MTTRRALAVALAIVCLAAAGCGGGGSSDGKQPASRVLPVKANPIHNTATAPGLKIDSVLVENNVDPATKKDAPDHLEIQLENVGERPLHGLEVYYEISDAATGDHEGYYSKLDAFSIAPGAKRTVHFDDTGKPDHFPDNPYSLYHLSQHRLDVKVTVSARGVAPQTASARKDAGGEENPAE